MSAASVQRVDVFNRDRGVCFASLTLPGHECYGRMVCAHLLPKAETRNHILGIQATPWRFPDHPLLTATVDEVIFDPDCAVPMCGIDGMWDRAGHDYRCFYDQLPQRFIDWSCQWNLYGRVLDYYPHRPAQPSHLIETNPERKVA